MKSITMKRLAFLLIALLITVSLSAWDVGGYLDNTTGLAKAPVGAVGRNGTPIVVLPVQSATIAAWLYHSFGLWSLDAQGSYTYDYPPVTKWGLLDLDRLVLGGAFPAEAGGARSLGFQIGRMQFSDSTGYVLDHSLDGLKLNIGWTASSFSAGVATSAVIQKPSSTIVMSNLDVEALGANPEDDPEIYSPFAPPKLIATAEFQARSLVAGQDLTLGAVVQEDLRPEAQLTPEFETAFDPTGGGGVMDTQYLSLMLSGGITQGFFHRTYYTLNTGRTLTYRSDADSITGSSYQYTPIFGHLAGLELSYFLPQVLNSRIRLGGQFSTGDADSNDYYDGNTNELATSFVPISASSYSDVFTLQPGNSGHVAVSYSLRPLSGIGLDILQTELSSVSYFRSMGGGPVSEGAVDATEDGAYIGTDIDLKIVAQPFSDLRFVLAGGLFLPNAAVMTTGNKKVDYQFTLQGVLRF
ncbi:MAG: hypothetical protein KOO61_08435 [Spirochaetales bacterium]|nr:hypothetical protein [Spirochaetales bacterium]